MPDQQVAEGLGRCDNARTETVIRKYGPIQLQDGRGRAAGQFRQQQAVFVKKLTFSTLHFHRIDLVPQ